MITKRKQRLQTFLLLGLISIFSLSACKESPVVVEPGIEQNREIPTPGATLSLTGEGIVMEESVIVQTANFGSGTNIAVEAVSAALGQPVDTQTSSECPAGPMTFTTWDNGFTINVIDDEFVGWSINSEETVLKTDRGIGVGSLRTDLESAYDTDVQSTTLGTEFNAENSLFGILASDAPDAEITNLWAGIACYFR